MRALSKNVTLGFIFIIQSLGVGWGQVRTCRIAWALRAVRSLYSFISKSNDGRIEQIDLNVVISLKKIPIARISD